MEKVTRNAERTARQILEAATIEFSEKGMGGARVDMISERAKVSKRMIYHYFGNKDDLFLAVMENAYLKIRTHERDLHLDNLPAVAAVKELSLYTFNYFIDNPEFIRLLNSENLFDAEHIKKSKKIRDIHFPLVEQIKTVLDRGVKEGVFRTDVDPVQLYISIAALGYFYLSNASTLGVIFGKDLRSEPALAARIAHVESMVLGYLRP